VRERRGPGYLKISLNPSFLRRETSKGGETENEEPKQEQAGKAGDRVRESYMKSLTICQSLSLSQKSLP
jgi:hypothetical protein